MPLYEYVCRSCGHRFETFKSVEERNDSVECPACEKDSRRVLSGFAVAKSTGSASSSSSAGGSSCGWSGG
jgi:putative FmdB family regulatory protein